MASPKFALEEIVFAKLRGWPAWPAKVEFFENIGSSSNKIKYSVYFYGTNQIAQCREEDLFPYTKYRNKFGRPKKNSRLNKAIAQADAELENHTSNNSNHSKLPGLNYLQAELKVLKIDRDIKSSLSVDQPVLDTCLELLQEYSELTISPLMFKKHPLLIDTLLKLQVYTIDKTPENETNFAELKKKIDLIRKESRTVYYKVQSSFDVPQGLTFLEYYLETLDKMQKHVASMSEIEILQLSYPMIL